MQEWLKALRLKTLPLSIGAISLGAFLPELSFKPMVFGLALLTAILLQILSNLSNDYGDFVKGTDKHRKDRQMASGKISKESMRFAIGFVIFCCLCSGIALLFLAFESNWQAWLTFFVIGLASIGAAIAYTIGKKAYGYRALGDAFVFLFFGGVGVLGSSYLMLPELNASSAMAAASYGALCVAVLNINNIRDIEKDEASDKITLAVKLGKAGAMNYHAFLLLIAVVGFTAHHLMTGYVSLAPIATAILAFIHYRQLQHAEEREDFNAQLKLLSLGSLVLVLIFLLRLYLS